MFESGAILVYLAEKTGRFCPTELRERISARWFRAISGREAVKRVAERTWKGVPIEAAFSLDPAAQPILFGWKSGS